MENIYMRTAHLFAANPTDNAVESYHFNTTDITELFTPLASTLCLIHKIDLELTTNFNHSGLTDLDPWLNTPSMVEYAITINYQPTIYTVSLDPTNPRQYQRMMGANAIIAADTFKYDNRYLLRGVCTHNKLINPYGPYVRDFVYNKNFDFYPNHYTIKQTDKIYFTTILSTNMEHNSCLIELDMMLNITREI